jgi:hypothetical protein
MKKHGLGSSRFSLNAPGDFGEMNLSETHLKDYMFVIFGTGLPRGCTLPAAQKLERGL